MISSFAQTIIDLERGGLVRSKNVEDYRKQDPYKIQKQREDSIAYNDCLNRALNAMYRDSLIEAKDMLNEALTLRPEAPSNYIVRHYLARIDMATGEFRHAAEILSELLKQNPEDKEVRHERAVCYLEAGNPRMALTDCQTLVDKAFAQEEKVRALFLRVAVYDALRLYQEEREDLTEILRIIPNNQSATLLLAMTYAKLGQNTVALQKINAYILMYPENAEGYAARAEMEVKQEQWQLARADYDKAVELNPDEPTYYIARAGVLEKLELTSIARQDREKAQQLLNR
jgi:tetratricopeptide (TPR) repeat protein